MSTARKRTKVVYISGPYRSSIELEVFKHIMQARDTGMLIWKAGGIPLIPHLNSFLQGGLIPIEEFLEGDCILVERCDAVLMIGLWHLSEGSLMEKKHAEKCGIPVFTLMSSLREWLEGRTV